MSANAARRYTAVAQTNSVPKRHSLASNSSRSRGSLASSTNQRLSIPTTTPRGHKNSVFYPLAADHTQETSTNAAIRRYVRCSLMTMTCAVLIYELKLNLNLKRTAAGKLP